MDCFILIAALFSVSADGRDPAALIRDVMDADRINAVKAANWLSREDVRRYSMDSKKPKLISWETYEASMVEGQHYYRLTARGGKPLKKAEREEEQEKLDREADRRRRIARMRSASAAAAAASSGEGEQGANPVPVFIRNRYSLALDHLLAYHDLQFSGEDQTADGRKYWIIDTRLRPSAPLPKERNDMALCGNVTLWVDQETRLLLRRELRVTRFWGDWGPGSSVLFEMVWNGEVMLLQRIMTRVQMPTGQRRDTEQMHSNFKKFGAQTEIRFDSAEIP